MKKSPTIKFGLLIAILATFLPAALSHGQQKKVGILYSATSRDKYFDQFSYYQAFMSAQHQCTMAGIPFELLDESVLANDANLSGYKVLVIPHFTHVKAANRNTYLTELGQAAANGLNIISADWLMAFNETGTPFPDAQLANESLVGVMWTNFNGPVTAALKVSNAAHPALQGYTQDETILTYQQVWADEFSPTAIADPAGTNAYCKLFVGSNAFNAVNAVTTTAGRRNVHFTSAQIMLDSNLLWSAIHWSLYGTQTPVALRTGRQRSLFFARNDMDQSMFPEELPTVEFPLLNIITDWKNAHNFVGSYYINIGNNPNQGAFTDWNVSHPLYQNYIALGSEIGTHSYTHPEFISQLTTKQLEFEFKTSKEVIQNNMGIQVTGGAIPGNPETPAEIEKISAWLPYVSGRSAISDSNLKYSTAYGNIRPGLPLFYNCLNTSPDFTLVGFLGYNATQAAQIWRTEIDNLHKHAPLPVVHWLWHDYGPVGVEPGFTRGMFDSTVAHAASLDTEFLTGDDFFRRNQAFRASNLDVTHPDANTIVAQVASSAAGKFSLQLPESTSIASVDNWYAFNRHKVFLPTTGGTFTIRTGSAPYVATRITALPSRSELVSLTGDGTSLNFTFRGQGKVSIAPNPTSTLQVTGANAVIPTANGWDLVFNANTLHTVSISRSTVIVPTFVTITSTRRSGNNIILKFSSNPNITGWRVVGCNDLASGQQIDHTDRATIVESPAGSGKYTATINYLGLGRRYCFAIAYGTTKYLP